MTKFYEFGKVAALREVGLVEKTAGGLWGQMSPFLEGAGGRALSHAGVGAGLGAAAGAVGAEDGHRFSGGFRGALAGGAAGAGLGAGRQMGRNLGGAAEIMAARNGASPWWGRLAKVPGNGVGFGASGAGMLGAGYAAGSTAQQSPWEKIKGYIPGLG